MFGILIKNNSEWYSVDRIVNVCSSLSHSQNICQYFSPHCKLLYSLNFTLNYNNLSIFRVTFSRWKVAGILFRGDQNSFKPSQDLYKAICKGKPYRYSGLQYADTHTHRQIDRQTSS